MEKPKILVLASGDASGGGSGFQEMVERSRTKPPILDAEIVAVVSNHPNGGVRQKADKLGIPFILFRGPYTAEEYQRLVADTGAQFVMCSGWLKLVLGLPEWMVINIHPGSLPLFGGLYGHHVHEAVIEAYRKGEITQSAVSMHFVNEEYDKGAGIVQIPVLIRPEDDPESLAARVLKVEHNYQSLVLNEIVHGRIFLDTEGQVHFVHNKALARFAFKNG